MNFLENNRNKGIQMRVGIVTIILAATAVNATAGVDFLQFYATREHQIFKEEDKRQTDFGSYEGEDESTFQVWEGYLSGKKFYLEVHEEKIRLMLGQRNTVLSFSRAPMLKGADKFPRELYLPTIDLYVKSTKDPSESLLCVESLRYGGVYLVTDPLSTPRLYRLSGDNSSCRGIERAPDGRLLVPSWEYTNLSKTPNVTIDYYAINKNSFRKTDIRVIG
jgi:hypothetical protein